MTKTFNIHFKRLDFRTQLLLGVSLGILGLALIASMATAWVTSKQVSKQMTAQGLKIVETLADQSVLALIYASPQNAQDPLSAILNFPDVIHAAIWGADKKPLLSLGVPNRDIIGIDPDPNLETATMVSETAKTWHFIAPVVAGKLSENIATEGFQSFYNESESEFLGFAYIVMDKTTLHKLQYSVFLNNIIIALAVALVLIVLVKLGIDRLIRPLYRLVQVMELNEKEGGRVHAELIGPKEITQLARGFNNLMLSLEERDKRLRKYGEMLEVEVAIRTRELVEARDAALTANRYKSEFLANISHELRTPLQAIIGYSDLAREELDFNGMQEQADQLDLVLTNAQRLLSMINNILNLSKIEAGKMELKLESVDLESVLDEAVKTVIPLMNYNNNRIQAESHGNKNELIIDREKLLQITLNLLSNAAKFTKNGDVSLSSQLTEKHLTIEVRDTGIGLTEDQLKVIFEEFRQVDGSITRHFEGTGLGLTISKGFCELMGGEIGVKSAPGEGSIFSVSIPLPVTEKKQSSPTDDIQSLN